MACGAGAHLLRGAIYIYIYNIYISNLIWRAGQEHTFYDELYIYIYNIYISNLIWRAGQAHTFYEELGDTRVQALCLQVCSTIIIQYL